MGAKRYKPEEIISKLREAEVLLSEGVSVGEVARRLGVTQVTYYRWRKEYGGMKVDQAKRLKDLEKENARLKRLLADAELGVSERRACTVVGQHRSTQWLHKTWPRHRGLVMTMMTSTVRWLPTGSAMPLLKRCLSLSSSTCLERAISFRRGRSI